MNGESILILLSVIQSGAIAGAMIFAGLQYRQYRSSSVYDVYNRFSDRMAKLRELMIADEAVRRIWDGGLEGRSLKETENEKHFYFAKMLLQINEAYYLALMDRDFDTDRKGFHFDAWRRNFKNDLTAQRFREMWTKHKIVRDSYDERFAKEVDVIIGEVERGEFYNVN